MKQTNVGELKFQQSTNKSCFALMFLVVDLVGRKDNKKYLSVYIFKNNSTLICLYLTRIGLKQFQGITITVY
jgi:hypothetical protein